MDRKRKADGTELSNIVIPEMDMSDSGTPLLLSPDAVPSARLAKMVVSDGTSSGPCTDGGASASQSKMAKDAEISARLAKMVLSDGTSSGPSTDGGASTSQSEMAKDAEISASLATMVLSDGTSSGPSTDGGASASQSKMVKDAEISARRSKMFQDAGTSACQNPAVTALLSIAAHNVRIASILRRVAQAKRNTLENKQLPEYRLGLDAVRLKELRALQVKEKEIVNEYVAKRREAQLEYQQKLNPLYQRRSEIVAGVTENDKGVPDFWLSALLGNALLDDEITKWDEYPLKHLMNINCFKTNVPERSLKLEFVFDGHNPYFDNSVLTKVFYYKSFQGEYVVDRTEESSINWHHARPHGKSFFNFFSACEDRADDGDDKLMKMNSQEHIAQVIRTSVMRHAYTLYLDTKASGKL